MFNKKLLLKHNPSAPSSYTVYGWGRNLGNTFGIRNDAPALGDTYPPSATLTSTTPFSKAVSERYGALYTDASGYLWGSGQINFATTTASQSWSSISSGVTAFAFRNDGALFAWGINTNGNMALNNLVGRSSPVQIAASSVSWNIVTSGKPGATSVSAPSYGIRNTGSLWGWGLNTTGRLADGTVISRSSPVQIGTSSWSAISASSEHTLAIRSDGALFGWGINLVGAAAVDNTSILNTSWTQLVAAGNLYGGYGIRSDGALFAWGDNAYGQVGTNDTIGRTSPVQIGTSSWTSVSSGSYFTLAIRSDGALFAWGYNANYQLGIFDTISRSSPVQIGAPGSSWSSVSAGNQHGAAIRNDGGLFMWGYGALGQLGNNSTSSLVSPTQVGTSSWSQVSAGNEHTLAIRSDGTLWAYGTNGAGQLGQTDGPTYGWTFVPEEFGGSTLGSIRSDGSLWTWGLNSVGQLGDNTIVNRSSPVQIGTNSWIQFASGADLSTFAIRSDGTLWAWGQNNFGQLGQNDLVNRSSPVQIGASSWSQVATVKGAVIALRTDGGIFTWGEGTSGQTGQNDQAHRSSPTQVGTSSWTSIGAGYNTMAAIRNDGGLFIWGNNANGSLGQNDVISRSSPIQVGTSSWSQVSTHESHTAAIRSDGTIWGWGVSVPTWPVGSTRSSPVQISAGSWTQVAVGQPTAAAGTAYILAIRNDGTLWGGGAPGTVGQLGDGYVRSLSWSQIGTQSWTKIGTGNLTATGITVDNLLWTWGNNANGQLGIRDVASRSSPTLVGPVGLLLTRSSPVQIGTSSWTAISAGLSWSAAIRADGTLWTWGIGSTYQNGLSPDQEWSWKMISTGQSHNAAIRSDDTLWMWGSINTNGELGWGTTIATNSPTQLGLSSWTAVSCGSSRTFAIRSDGSLWAWGANASGNLGLNDVASRSSPVQIGTSSWIAVAAGVNNTYAIRSDGTLWGWGGSLAGSNGDGFNVNRSSPVQISSSSWSAVAAGASNGFAIRSDGRLFGWGANESGQLGQNDRIHRSSPVQIGTDSWTKVAAGVTSLSAGYVGAIRSDNTLWVWGNNTNGQLGQLDFVHRSSPVQMGLRSWTSIGVAQGSFYGSMYDGTLWGWGFGSTGQPIGNGTNVGYSSPTQITTSFQSGTGSSFQKLTTLPYTSNSNAPHYLALSDSKSLFGWGSVAWALGISYNAVPIVNGFRAQNALVVGRSSPTQVGIFSNWTQVFTGANAGYGRRSDGSLWSWGSNTGNGLVNGITSSAGSFNFPFQIGSTSWSQISATKYVGADTVLGITSTGQGYIGGNVSSAGGLNFNFGGPAANAIMGGGLRQLGLTYNLASPNQIGTSSWTKVAAGIYHSAAIRTDGALFTWGSSPLGTSILFNPDSGALGYNELTGTRSPQQVGTSSWSQVAVGNHFTAALRSDGALFTWGVNREGTLGDNTVNWRSSPVQIGTSSWTSIAAGVSFMAAIRSDGGLFAWGDNADGQLGQNDLVHRSSPVQIGTSSWTVVDVAYKSVFARRLDGALFAWGNNVAFGGLLGLGDSISRSSPVQIGGTANYQSYDSPIQIGSSTYNEISRGSDINAVIRSDGTLWTWGTNALGVLGQNDILHRSSPVQIGSGTWSKVSVGSNYLLAIATNGSLWGTGDFTGGKLGEQKDITYSWAQVSESGSHVLAIRSDGTLWGWGDNSAGALGVNDIIYRSSPVQIGTSSWTAVCSAANWSLALRNDGGLFAWGRNLEGQLGQNDVVYRSSPIQIGTSSWTAIASGNRVANGAAAIRLDGRLFTWGSNSNGELGLNNTIHRSSPVQIDATSSWIAVTGGTIFMFGIKSDNTLWSWGSNAATGVLGTNETSVLRSSPVQIGTSSWTKVSSGGGHALAIRNDGTMWGWGNATQGQLGEVTGNLYSWTMLSISDTSPGTTAFAIRSDGTLWGWGAAGYGQIGDNQIASNRSSPVQVSGSWTKVVTGQFFGMTAAIRSDGTLWTWGNATGGKLGDNASASRSSPVQVAGGGSWSQVAVDGGSSAFAIKTDGTLWSWGASFGGSNGDSATNHRSSPVQIGASSWTAISGKDYGAIAIRADGTLWGWGFNGSGQNGTNNIQSASSPVLISSSSWSALGTKMAGGTSFAIRSDGTLWGWGVNDYGQLGQADTVNRSSPVQVSGSWKAVASFFSTVVAIKSDNSLWTWGAGSTGGTAYGLFGDETSIHRSSPVQVGLGNSWNDVSAGRGTFGAIETDNTLWMWGDAASGQLGDNTIVSKSSPVQVGPNTPVLISRSSPVQLGLGYSWSAITAGVSHSAAIRLDGKLFTWGLNSSGELGVGNAISRSSPTQVGVRSWSIISAGGINTRTGGITSDSLLFVWGGDTFGSAGDETVIFRSSPVIIGLRYPQVHRSSPVQVSSSSWSVVSAGISHSAAIRTDGALFTWGQNGSGQLGQNDLIHRSSPIQVGTSSWTAVSVGGTHTVAIRNDGTMWAWGINTFRQLGDNASAVPLSWTMVASRRKFGGSHTVAIRSDGTLWAWGLNSVGQLGDGTTIHRSSPVQISTSSWSMVAVNQGSPAVGLSFFPVSAAIRSDGALFMWGANPAGAVGDNTVASRSSPVQIGTSSWTSVSVGQGVFAIRTDGRLFAWGSNERGQLGLGDQAHRSSPSQVGTSSWTFVAASMTNAPNSARDVTLAIKSNNTIWSWGDTYSLGTNEASSISPQATVQNSPVQLSLSTSYSWTQVASDGDRHYALDSNGDLYGWGLQSVDNFTEVNLNEFNAPYRTPASWSMVAVGLYHTVGIRSDGSLWAWGYGTAGQLGDNSTATRSSMIQIGTSSWTAVAAGAEYTMALRTDGALFTWGRNLEGQLGHNDVISYRSSPTQVGTSSWIAISGGSTAFALAIRSDGRLFAWGYNTNGELGQNDRIHRSSPVQIGTDSWTQVAASVYGDTKAIALRNDGAIFAWGQNDRGQLGLNDTVYRSSPVQIGTSSWTQVYSGSLVGGALRSDNTLWVWGSGDKGTTGQNDQVHRSSPVQITAFGRSTFSVVSVGSQYSSDPGWFALTTDKLLLYWGSGYAGRYWIGQVSGISSPVVMSLSTNPRRYINKGADVGSFTVSNHGNHYGAINTSGLLTMWGGGNNYGEKGRPDLEPYGLDFAGPRLVGGIQRTFRPREAVLMATGVKSVSPFGSSTTSFLSVLKTDSTVAAVGFNGSGGMGTNDVLTRSSITVVSSTKWKSVSEDISYGIDSENLLYWWGNYGGPVGDSQVNTTGGGSSPVLVTAAGLTISRSSPVQIGAGRSWAAVSAGVDYNIAIASDRTLWVWGNAGVHTLGRLLTTGFPSRVGSLNSWMIVDANHTNNADGWNVALLKP